MKKFIRTNGKKIELIHYMPFDKEHGFGKTEQELLQEGHLVDEIPEPENREGYIAKPCWDDINKKIYYEYIEATNR